MMDVSEAPLTLQVFKNVHLFSLTTLFPFSLNLLQYLLTVLINYYEHICSINILLNAIYSISIT